MMEEMSNENSEVKIDFVHGPEKPNRKKNDLEDSGEEPQNDIRPFLGFRDKTLLVLHSYKFQLCVIGLVILDCLLVISEMLLDLQKTDQSHQDLEHSSHIQAAHALHYASIAILSIFIVELGFKLYAYQLEFFHHKLEVFDAVVVVLSFALDIAYIHVDSAVIATGFIVLLRLWRIARILNGVLLSVKTQAEHKLNKEKQLRATLEEERFRDREHIAALESEANSLRNLLKEHGIPVPN